MDSIVKNLIDIKNVYLLLESFNKTTGFVTHISDIAGNILYKSDRKQSYIEFQKENPESSVNGYLSNSIHENKLEIWGRFHICKSNNGLFEVTAPVIISGEHVANLYSGQFFLEEPDWDYFREQAVKYGYDEQKYLNAIAQLPVASEDKARNALDILINMIESYIASAWQKSDNLTPDFDETEAALIDVQEKYRILFETLPLGVIHQNAAGEIISANPASQEILGITMDQMRGKTSMDTRWKMIREDGSEVPGSEHPSMIALSTGEKVGPVIRGVFIPERHEYVWLSITAIPLCRPGESTPYQSYSIFQDITLTKKSEQLIEEHRQLLETVVHHLPVAINVLSGDDFRIELANPVYRAIAPGKEMTGLTWEELWPETGQEFAQICRRVIETGEPFKVLNQHNTIRRTPDGPIEDTYFSWELHRIKLPGDKGWGLLGSTWETTELVKANIRLKKVLDAENVGVMFWDTEHGVLTDANEAFLKLMGYSRDDIEGQCFTWQKFTPEEYHDISLEEMEKFKSVGRVGPYEKEYYCKDGSRKWFLFAGSALSRNECVEFCVDITDRKNVEKELEQKQILINEMGKAARVGGWEFDAETGKGTWTEETARIHDLDPYDPTNVDIGLSFYKPESKVILEKAIKKAIQNKEPYDLELEIVSAIGTEKWVHSIGKPVIEGGKVVKMRGSFQDITERKKAEISLSESEARYRSLFENMNAGFVLFEAVTNENNQGDLIILAANSQFEKTTGLVLKDAIGQPLTQVLPGIEKDKADWIGKYSKVAFTGKPESFEQGSELLGYYYSISAFQAGQNQCAVTFIDITERKRNEIKLRESYDLIRIAGEKAKLGGWVVLLEENLMYWSDEVAAIHEMPLGYSPQVEEGIKFYAPEWRDKIIEVYGKCLKDGIPYDEEMEIITATGKRIWVRTIGEAIRNESGKIYKIQGAFQDITLKKIAEEELRKSKHDLEDFFENDISANYVVSASGEIISCNKTFLNLFGFENKSETQKLDITNLYKKPEDRKQLIRLVRNHGKVENYEMEFITQAGKPIYTLINAIGIFDKNNKLEKIRGYIVDITNLKDIEKELQESKENYVRFFEEDITGNYRTSLGGKVLMCNEAFVKMLKYSSKENIYGINTADLYFENANREKFLDKVRAEKRIKNNEWPLKASDGSVVEIIENVVGVFDESGELSEIIGYMTDITEQKKAQLALIESEKKFRDLFQYHAAIKLIIDPNNGNIEEANQAAADFYGWTVEELTKMNIAQINTMLSNDLMKEMESAPTLTKNHFEFKHLKADGSLVDVEVFSSSVEINGKQYLHTIIQDISEKKKAERALLELNRELEKRVELRTEQLSEVNKELEAFTYSVSHDLRGPLRAINGFTEILMEDYAELLPESAQKTCLVIRKNAIIMGNLISNLLKLSRMSKSEMLFSDIDMNALADAVYIEITSVEQRKRISFIHDNLENCHGDGILLKQVLINLISNAVKYTGKIENPVIEMKSEIVDENIIYTIIDNGAGFDMNHYNMLFGVFQRLHTDSEFEGTGVGLAIVHRIISRHEGKVWAEGAVGKGAKFFFTIPIVDKRIM